MPKLCFWNIGGARDKLQKIPVRQMLYKFDLIFISEIKNDMDLYLPGYMHVRCSKRYSNRGGICLLLKDSYGSKINTILCDNDDAIWIILEGINNIVFASAYVPPQDSSYFKDDILACIQERLKHTFSGKSFVCGGDFNARLGDYSSLSTFNMEGIKYVQSDDPTNNSSGRICRELWSDSELIVLNNMCYNQKCFKVGLTFRRKGTYISEIDHIVCSKSLLDTIVAMQKIVGDGTFIPPSDHDPLGLELDFSHLVQPNLIAVLSHAESLGQTFVKDQSVSRRPLNMRNIDVGELERLLGDPEDICLQSDTVDACFKELSDHVYDICKQAKSPNRAIPKTSNKWEYVTNNNDPKALWAAIGWNGSVLAASEETPSDEEFCNHFEDLLYPHPSDVDTLDVSDAPNIPVLDDPISQLEFENAVGKCKPNKCAGNDGIPPGVWRVMPVKWKLAILTLFNIVFLYTMYPMEWCYSRLVTIFKKGRTSMCVNYRGIAISDGIIKLFDLIMLNRLKLWYKPRPEQAGAQVGRGCLEQILALRLIISYALTKRAKLWIVYVDFKQAYDRVPRLKLLLLQELKKKGCGQTFLRINF